MPTVCLLKKNMMFNLLKLMTQTFCNRQNTFHRLDEYCCFIDTFGTWATENDIFIAATVFQLNVQVSVLSTQKGSQHLEYF